MFTDIFPSSTQFTRLQSLRLSRFGFQDRALLEFIQRHLSCLKNLTLSEMFLDRPWSDFLCGMRELDIRWNEFLLLGDADDRGKIDSDSAIENEDYPPIKLPISEEIGAFVLGSSDELPQSVGELWRIMGSEESAWRS